MARFEEIFFNDINVDTLEYKLYILIRKFTKLAFSWDINENDLEQFDRISIDIIKCVNQIEQKRTTSETTTNVIKPKLHFLTHYGQLTKMFGPLVLWSTLDFERKHQVFKQKANILKNFINPSKSFMVREQIKLALGLANNKKLAGVNDLQEKNFGLLDIQMEEMVKFKLESEKRPHKLDKCLIFKINHSLMIIKGSQELN